MRSGQAVHPEFHPRHGRDQKFTPAGSRAGSLIYSGRLTNAPMTATGRGTYKIALNKAGTAGTLTYTQSGLVHGGGASTSTWKLAMVAVPAC